MTPEQLKASILQYAIQGKLVEQRPEEGTAENLYKAIQEEKQQYKIKTIETNPMEEPPFDIPDSWKWIQLQDIVKKTIKRGKSPKYTENSNIQVFAQKCNVKTGGINMELAQYLDINASEKYPDEEYMINGDIIINSTGGGTMGRVGIFHDTDRLNNMKIVPDGHVTIIRACDMVDYKYLYYFIKHNQKYLETQGEGSTNQIELKPITIASLALPLPPLAEQHRIVAKIEEMLPYVERYAASYEKLEQFNAKFPEDMKKSILQYAIQGKLVEQRPEEGTAEDLYKSIQEEKQKLIKEGKIKKEKPLAEITEDEIPFDIPDNWKWMKLGECINLLSGQDLTADRYNEKNEGTIYLTGASNLDDNENIIINRWTTSPTSVAHKGDLLLTCKGTIGKTAILTVDEAHIARQIMAITGIQLDTTFIKYFIKISVDMLQRKAKSMIPGIDRDTVRNLLLPLPPLEEQHRIVAKIEELLPYCDQLIK